jgi:hypothetical protein
MAEAQNQKNLKIKIRQKKRWVNFEWDLTQNRGKMGFL